MHDSQIGYYLPYSEHVRSASLADAQSNDELRTPLPPDTPGLFTGVLPHPALIRKNRTPEDAVTCNVMQPEPQSFTQR